MKLLSVALLVEYCSATAGERAYSDKVTMEYKIQFFEKRVRDIDSKIERARHRASLEDLFFPDNECDELVNDFDVVTRDELSDFDQRADRLLRILGKPTHGLEAEIAQIRDAYRDPATLCRILLHVRAVGLERMELLERQKQDIQRLMHFVSQKLDEAENFLFDSSLTDYLDSCAPGTLFRAWVDLAETNRMMGDRVANLMRLLYPVDAGSNTYYTLWRSPCKSCAIQKSKNEFYSTKKPRTISPHHSVLIDQTIRSYIETGVNRVRQVFVPEILDTYNKDVIDHHIKDIITGYRHRIEEVAVRMSEIETKLVPIDAVRW